MSQSPTISLLHPTARVRPSEAFPRGWRDAYDVWLERADHPENIEYILSVHSSRWEDFCESDYSRTGIKSFDDFGPRRFGLFLAVENKLRDCVVDQLNNCALNASGKLFCGVQDDVIPPEHWDTLLIDALPSKCPKCGGLTEKVGTFLPYSWDCPTCTRPMPARRETIDFDGEYLIHFSSGSPRDKDLIVAGAITRKRYERYGYCLDPDFESMFADDWLTFQARRDEAAGLGKIIERLDIEFEHLHPAFGKGKVDEIYALQNRAEAYKVGELTFIQKTTGKKILLICLPGENFRSMWVQNTLNMLFGLGPDVLPVPFWNYSSNVYATRMEMARAAIEFRPRAEWVLWKDDDQDATAQQVTMLAQDLKDNPELEVVTGFSWCDNHEEKSHELNEWSLSCGRQRWSDLQCNRFRGPDIVKALEGSGLITSDDVAPHVFWSGFPLVLMKMSALEKLGAEAFRARTTDPEMLGALEDLLSCGLDEGEFAYMIPEKMIKRARLAVERAKVIASCKFGQTSEDTSFFMRCFELGIKCAVDVRVEAPHVKPRAIRPQFIPTSQLERIEREVGKASFDFGPLNMMGSEERRPESVGAD